MLATPAMLAQVATRATMVLRVMGEPEALVVMAAAVGKGVAVSAARLVTPAVPQVTIRSVRLLVMVGPVVVRVAAQAAMAVSVRLKQRHSQVLEVAAAVALRLARLETLVERAQTVIPELAVTQAQAQMLVARHLIRGRAKTGQVAPQALMVTPEQAQMQGPQVAPGMQAQMEMLAPRVPQAQAQLPGAQPQIRGRVKMALAELPETLALPVQVQLPGAQPPTHGPVKMVRRAIQATQALPVQAQLLAARLRIRGPVRMAQTATLVIRALLVPVQLPEVQRLTHGRVRMV